MNEYTKGRYMERQGDIARNKKTCTGRLLRVFRRPSETARDCYMVPRRRLNWRLFVSVYNGMAGSVSVRHTRGHTRRSVLLPFIFIEGARFSHDDEQLRAHPGNSPHYASNAVRRKSNGLGRSFHRGS